MFTRIEKGLLEALIEDKLEDYKDFILSCESNLGQDCRTLDGVVPEEHKIKEINLFKSDFDKYERLLEKVKSLETVSD